jgi:hypothetical protein
MGGRTAEGYLKLSNTTLNRRNEGPPDKRDRFGSRASGARGFMRARAVAARVPRKKQATGVSTAAVVRDYIDTHPSIKDGMRMGISQRPRKAPAVLSGGLRPPFSHDARLPIQTEG